MLFQYPARVCKLIAHLDNNINKWKSSTQLVDKMKQEMQMKDGKHKSDKTLNWMNLNCNEN